MSNIYCIKCNVEAFGKCPKCRSVFIEKSKNITKKQLDCKHVFEYKKPKEKCIYGCGYSSS